MTVEETSLPQVRTGQRPREECLTLTLAKVREVTGASDEVIEEAIKACRCKDGTFKVEDVVTTIIGDDTVSSSTTSKSRKPPARNLDNVDAQAGSPSSTPAITVGTHGEQAGQRKTAGTTGGWKQDTEPNDYIDLTRDPQGILGGQISREEQDISRVLEASLAESKGSTKRKRGEIWFVDPLNPHERKRSDGWPVGLRNVGNTCWFSAVIQSLFHIQKFRNIVLNYKSRPLPENENNHKLRFVCELRQLFGLMVGSHRKYVDPSMAVSILKEASSTTALDGQQDVSEFQHKLLDWLEDAFSEPPRLSSSPAAPNPVHQLFQGKYKAEGFNQGKAFSHEVTFGQYPLNVLGFRDIHESLEATTAQGEIETVTGDKGHKSGQEIWFTRLPVVLTFELSRFGFNHQLNRAEKIHQQLSFPPVIYVDRYLECNKSVTRQKREEARKLKEELAELQAKLDRFMNYGSNSKRYPLPDVLQYALEFAQSSPGGRRSPSVAAQASAARSRDASLCEGGDVEMKSPGPNTSREVQDVSMSSVAEDHTSSSLLTSTPATTSALPTSTTTQGLSVTQAPSSLPTPHISADTPRLCSSLPPTSTAPNAAPCTPSQPSPYPEAKKFKDSSVQVEFEARLMPVAMATDPHQSSSLSAKAQSLPLLSSSPSSSSPSSPTVAKVKTTSLPPFPSSSSLSSPPGTLLGHAPSTCADPSLYPLATLPPTVPHPRTCSVEELVVLQGCLRRWREEVEADVRELQRNISSLEGKLNGMYSEERMKKYPYHLHAVLVHEGQAVSGHYWSFIHSWSNCSGSTSTGSSSNIGGGSNSGNNNIGSISSSGNINSGSSSTNNNVGIGGSSCSSEQQSGRWLKFNDITVSESSLAEVEREGVGGHHNTSAYCLMYIDRSRLEVGQGDANSSAAPPLSSLPQDLQRAVDEDNVLFTQEVAAWDEEQRRKMAAPCATPHPSPAHTGGAPPASAANVSTSSVANPKSASTMTTPQPLSGSRPAENKGQGKWTGNDPDVVMTGEQRPGESSIMRPMNSGLAALADAHAQLSLQATLTSVTDMHGRGNNSAGNLHPMDVFKGAMEKEMMRLKGLSRTVSAQLPSEDPRLSHIVLYLLTSGADSHTVRVVLAEQFALCGLLDSASTVKGVRHEAQEIYKALYLQAGAEGVKCYEFWHKRYHHYRQAVFMFTEGVTAYIANKFQEALPYFNQACLHNCEPGLTSSLQAKDGLNSAWLGFYRRATLQRVNELALQSFERDEDLSDSLTVMSQQILPTLAMVGGSDLTEDQALVENIRGVWCQFLEKDLTEYKVEKLQDFLSKMFELSGTCLEEPHRVKTSLLDSLADRYRRAMRRLKETGDLALLVALSGS